MKIRTDVGSGDSAEQGCSEYGSHIVAEVSESRGSFIKQPSEYFISNEHYAPRGESSQPSISSVLQEELKHEKSFRINISTIIAYVNYHVSNLVGMCHPTAQ